MTTGLLHMHGTHTRGTTHTHSATRIAHTHLAPSFDSARLSVCGMERRFLTGFRDSHDNESEEGNGEGEVHIDLVLFNG